MTIPLSPEQSATIAWVVEQLKAGVKVVAITGLAGTGKSYLIGSLRAAIEAALQHRVDIGAPTHRAAMVLRMKGVRDAETIHHLALEPLYDDDYTEALQMVLPRDNPRALPYTDETPMGLLWLARQEWDAQTPWPGEARLQERAQRYGAEKALRSVGITAKGHVVGYGPRVQPGSTVLCDEASMVGQELLTLCREAYSQVVLIGDPGQLPPVNDVPALSLVPGRQLLEIHRQGASSTILPLAYAAREGTVNWYGNLRGSLPDVVRILAHDIVTAQQVPLLVWSNKARLSATTAMRKVLGYHPQDGLLRPGEPLVCRNTHAEDRLDGYYNNGFFRIVAVDPLNPRWIQVISEDEEEVLPMWVQVHMEELDGPYVEPKAVLFRFGYALTAHMAQGGEWPVVAVDMTDLLAHRATHLREGNKEEPARWQYTCLTRAKRQVLLLSHRVFRRGADVNGEVTP